MDIFELETKHTQNMIKTAFSNRIMVVMALLGSVILFTSMKPSGLTVNLRENPLGIDSKEVILSLPSW